MRRIYLAGLLACTKSKHSVGRRVESLAYISISCLSDALLEKVGHLLTDRLESIGGVSSFPMYRLLQTTITLPPKTLLECEKALQRTSQNTYQRDASVWVMWQRYEVGNSRPPGTRVVYGCDQSFSEVCVWADMLGNSSALLLHPSSASENQLNVLTHPVTGLSLGGSEF